MYAFLVLIALALGLSIARRAFDELLPVPASISRLVALGAGAGLAWMLGYSAFAAFGQDLRAEWMHPVMTGVVLVATGEFVQSVVEAIGRRADGPAAPSASVPRAARAA